MLDWRDPAVAARVQADAAGHARPRADQRQRGDRHVLRVAVHRPDARADRDPEGVPRLHAPAGDVLGRDRDRALPDARRASRRAATCDGFRRTRSRRACARSRSCSCPPRSSARCSPSRSSGSSTSAAPGSRPRRRSSPAALAAFSAGLVFNGAMLMLNRAFFSLQSNWIPTIVALGNLALNAILDAVFYRFGTWGIPLATAVCNIVGDRRRCVLLLRRRLGRLDGGEIARVDGRASSRRPPRSPSSPTSSGGRSTRRSAGRSPRQVVSLGLALVASIAAYVDVCRALSGARDAGATLLAEPRPRAARRPWTSRTSATSRSSRTSTTASRRSPTASSS